MKLYEYSPQKNTKKLATVTGALLGGAVILILMYIFIPDLGTPWMFQLLAVGMLMLAVFITARYIMKSYVYAIIEENGEKLLTVNEVQGRHNITVCRLSLSGLETAIISTKGDKPTDTALKDRIRSEKRKSFNYCSDLFDEKYICIFSTECGDPIAVKLSWDQKLEDMLEEELQSKAEPASEDQSTDE